MRDRKARPAPETPGPDGGPLWTTLTWTRESLAATRGGRFAADTFDGIRAVVHGFRGERISLRAAALTYISIFSLVPLLTVALVLLESLHQEEFHRRMESFIHQILAPGIREETATLLNGFIARASSVAAGGIGFLILGLSGGMLLKNLDASLNEIWNVRKKRPWYLRLVIYAFVLLLGPVLLAVSLAGTASAQDLLVRSGIGSAHRVTTLASFLLAASTFTFLYYLAPNAPVRLRSALAGGLVAGAAWDLSRYGYTLFGAEIFRYNPVYGSLGAMPLFLAWIYLTWLLVLFGARLAYAVEHATAGGLFRALGEHPRARELVAARIAEEVARAQLAATAPPTARELCRLLEVSEERVREVAERLERNGLLVTTSAGGLVPARLPDQLTLAELSSAVGGLPPAGPGLAAKEETFREVEEIFSRNDEATRRTLERITWADLANQRRNRRAGEDPATERVAAPRGRRIL